MGFFNFGKKSKLLELQNILFDDISSKLIVSEKELYFTAQKQAQLYMDYIRKSLKIVNTTSLPQLYFENFETLLNFGGKLVELEPYISFSGDSPSKSLEDIKRKEQESIYDFLGRYLENFCNNSNETISADIRYELFIKSLRKYYPRMNENNLNYIKKHCKDEICKIKEDIEINCPEDMIEEAIKIVTEAGQASTSMLQRKMQLGYAKAGKIIDDMEKLGIVGSYQGSKTREILMSYNQWIEHKKHLNLQLEKTLSTNSIQNFSEDVLKNGSKEAIHKANIEIISKLIGTETNYSNDVYFINDLENFVIPSSEENTEIYFINNLIKHASYDTLKIILANNNQSHSRYDKLPHLLVPVIYDTKKILTSISWLVNEMTMRLNIFSEYKCENIKSYNDLVSYNIEKANENLEINGLPVSKKKMPYIVFIVREMSFLNNHPEIDKDLLPILLNSKSSGIYMFFFSKFSIKNLSLGAKEDLIKIANYENLKAIFNQKNQSTNENLVIPNNLDGYEFEKFCCDLLEKNGYTDVTQTQLSGDNGIDILANKDGIKYAIQCKCYTGKLGNKAVQEAYTGLKMYNCDIGVVMTNSYFTESAINTAEQTRIRLWDRDYLTGMLNTTQI